MRSALFIAIILLLSIITIPRCNATDTDHDGLSDDWENAHGTDPTSVFSGGRVAAAWTYNNSWYGYQMTSEKVDELMSHGINTFMTEEMFWVGCDIHFEDVPDFVKEMATFAKQKGFTLIQGFAFTYTPPPEYQDDYFNVVYSDGVQGTHVSPFCQAYWQRLTDIAVSFAALPVNNPDLYSMDGICFDFELYAQESGRPNHFDQTWGFENSTFDAYCQDRHTGWSSATIPADERFDWLVDHGNITLNLTHGQHTGDYYLFLSQLIHGFAVSMREQVAEVNPDFLLGAYPSPSLLTNYWYWYYLPEIYSGWSNRTHPMVVWATEMYNYGGEDRIPPGLQNTILPEGYYNLTTIYPSHITPEYTMYGYYVSGLINYCYYSGNWAYHLYNLLINTSGYWIYTTQLFTADPEDAEQFFPILPCYDETNNTVFYCDNLPRYEQEVQAYYSKMDLAHSELSHYLVDPSYQTSIHKIVPPAATYEEPTQGYLPSYMVVPRNSTYHENISLAPNQFKGQQNFIIYATENQTVQIRLKLHQRYWDEIYQALTYVVQNSTYQEITRGTLRDHLQQTDVTFTAPATGDYILMVNPQQCTFEVTKTNAPVCLYGAQTQIEYTTSIFYFWVGNISTFTIRVNDNGPVDGFNTTILRPLESGYTAVISRETTQTTDTYLMSVTVPPDGKNTTWRLDVTYPSPPQLLENVYITWYNPLTPCIGMTDNASYFMIRNHPPTAKNDSFSVQQGSNNNILDVLSNDNDSDSDELEICNITQPVHGNASIDENGTCLFYTPQAGFNGDDTFTYVITDEYGYNDSATVSVHIESSGGSGNGGGSYSSQSETGDNVPPQTPMQPSGSISIITGVNYTYNGSTIDINGDALRYRFNWSDGNISSWSPLVPANTSASLSHHWETAATYEVRVQAQDEHGVNSSWSDPLTVVVSEAESGSESPSVNFTFSPEDGTNQTIVFNASESIDPDGVIVSYYWDFGDGENGTGKLVTHHYAVPGLYNVTLIVTDNNDNTVMTTITIIVSAEAQVTVQKTEGTPFLFYGIFIIGGGIAVAGYYLFSPDRRIRRLSQKIERMKAKHRRNTHISYQKK